MKHAGGPGISWCMGSEVSLLGQPWLPKFEPVALSCIALGFLISPNSLK